MNYLDNLVLLSLASIQPVEDRFLIPRVSGISSPTAYMDGSTFPAIDLMLLRCISIINNENIWQFHFEQRVCLRAPGDAVIASSMKPKIGHTEPASGL